MSNSNIHGVNHNSDNNNNNNYRYDLNGNESIFAKSIYRGDPREQSIPNFIKETLCPLFTFKSFSFVIIVINVVLYIVTLIPHGLNGFEMFTNFLPPSDDTLDDFGNLYGYGMRQKPLQFYRWITHNVLHAHFEHVFSNCFCILIFGTMFEYLIGTWRYIIIYVLSGIIGGLFSVLCKPSVSSVGASICCYGLIGGILGFDIINWNQLTRIYGIKNKCIIIMFPMIMIIFSLPLMFSTTGGSGIAESNNINIWGHFGGLIFGLFLSFFVIKPRENTDSCGFNYKIYFFCGIGVVASFTLIGFLCFYLLDSFKKYSS